MGACCDHMGVLAVASYSGMMSLFLSAYSIDIALHVWAQMQVGVMTRDRQHTCANNVLPHSCSEEGQKHKPHLVTTWSSPKCVINVSDHLDVCGWGVCCAGAYTCRCFLHG